MSQSLKCPSCNAPLEIEDAYAVVIECDFCGVSSKMNNFSGGGQGFEMHFGGSDLLDQARKLKEIKHLAQTGNKIYAIKLYRETFGVGLAEAKDAVENIIDGKPVVFANVQSFTTAHTAFGTGVGGDLGETLDQAFQLAKIQAGLQRGNKINAIRLYREAFGVGLAEAKTAVEAMERGESIDISGMQVHTSNARVVNLRDPQNLEAVKKVGLAVGGSFLLTFIIIAVIVIGAIIGELPVGSTRGLGVQLVVGSQYNTFNPGFLWATILMAALLGLVFYGIVALIERWVVRWRAPVQE